MVLLSREIPWLNHVATNVTYKVLKLLHKFDLVSLGGIEYKFKYRRFSEKEKYLESPHPGGVSNRIHGTLR